jgi:hypothetical protein
MAATARKMHDWIAHPDEDSAHRLAESIVRENMPNWRQSHRPRQIVPGFAGYYALRNPMTRDAFVDALTMVFLMKAPQDVDEAVALLGAQQWRWMKDAKAWVRLNLTKEN